MSVNGDETPKSTRGFTDEVKREEVSADESVSDSTVRREFDESQMDGSQNGEEDDIHIPEYEEEEIAGRERLRSSFVEIQSLEEALPTEKVLSADKTKKAQTTKIPIKTSTKTAKEIKPKSLSILEMILQSLTITEIAERNGTSFQAIRGYLENEFSLDVKRQSTRIKMALKAALAGELIIQTTGRGANGRFKLVKKPGNAKKPKKEGKKAADKKNGDVKEKPKAATKNKAVSDESENPVKTKKSKKEKENKENIIPETKTTRNTTSKKKSPEKPQENSKSKLRQKTDEKVSETRNNKKTKKTEEPKLVENKKQTVKKVTKTKTEPKKKIITKKVVNENDEIVKKVDEKNVGEEKIVSKKTKKVVVSKKNNEQDLNSVPRIVIEKMDAKVVKNMIGKKK